MTESQQEVSVEPRAGTRTDPSVGRVQLYGFLHGVLAALFLPGANLGNHIESFAIARSLVETGSFANPYAPLHTGPTAHAGPLYPPLLAVLMRCFGASRLGLAFELVLANALAFGTMLALLPAISESVFANREVGQTTAWAAIVIPFFTMHVELEGTFLELGLAAFVALSLERPQRPWLVGIAVSLIALLSPGGISFLAVWLIGLLVTKRWTRRAVIIAGITAAIGSAPWDEQELHGAW